MGQIIELPDIAALKREIQELKKSLEELVFERDELRFVVCENIKMTYMLEIGNLEYRVYDAYCDYLRLRRKKEFIQAKKIVRSRYRWTLLTASSTLNSRNIRKSVTKRLMR